MIHIFDFSRSLTHPAPTLSTTVPVPGPSCATATSGCVFRAKFHHPKISHEKSGPDPACASQKAEPTPSPTRSPVFSSLAPDPARAELTPFWSNFSICLVQGTGPPFVQFGRLCMVVHPCTFYAPSSVSLFVPRVHAHEIWSRSDR